MSTVNFPYQAGRTIVITRVIDEDLQRVGWSSHLDNLAAYLQTTR